MNLALGEALAAAGLKGLRPFENIERDILKKELNSDRESVPQKEQQKRSGGNIFEQLWADEKSRKLVVHLLHAFLPPSKTTISHTLAPCSICKKADMSGGSTEDSTFAGSPESRSVFCPKCWEIFLIWSEKNKNKIKDVATRGLL